MLLAVSLPFQLGLLLVATVAFALLGTIGVRLAIGRLEAKERADKLKSDVRCLEDQIRHSPAP